MKALDLLYPPKCVFCTELLSGKEKFICELCKDEVKIIQGETCEKCGRPLSNENKACETCKRRENSYGRNHALFLYEENVREAIRRFKYDRKEYYADYFGAEMAKNFYETVTRSDFLLPVPMYYFKEKRRGYNQAVLLAKEISAKTSVPVIMNALIRKRNTRSQSGLSGVGRRSNLLHAFAAGKNVNMILGKEILLVDDIYTTGSTLQTCADILFENGARSVNSLTLSVTVPIADQIFPG